MLGAKRPQGMSLLSKKMLLRSSEGYSGFELFYQLWGFRFLLICGWLVRWLADWLVGWLVDYSVGLGAHTWGLKLLLQCM